MPTNWEVLTAWIKRDYPQLSSDLEISADHGGESYREKEYDNMLNLPSLIDLCINWESTRDSTGVDWCTVHGDVPRISRPPHIHVDCFGVIREEGNSDENI